MGISLDTEAAVCTSNDIVSMVKALGDGEKFKQDAFFFCGFPSEAPNEELMYACQKYVAMAEAGERNKAVIDRLISELEKAAEKSSGLKENMNITSSKSEIEAILAARDKL